MHTTELTVVGVPEHFNLPWRLLADSGLAERLGIRLTWDEVREGTGAMIERLRDESADVALLLSEGAVTGIANGGGLRILGEFVASPLNWGVHVAARSPIQSSDELAGKTFAISRKGSGSHLMASVYARSRAWPRAPLDFIVVDTLDGARAALADGRADIFLWEQFTTQPFVDSGEFRRVDVIPTPWPCFVACLGDHAADRAPAAQVLLKLALAIANGVKHGDGIESLISAQYQLAPDQVTAWLALTEWSADGHCDEDEVARIARTLDELGLLERLPDARQCLVESTAPD